MDSLFLNSSKIKIDSLYSAGSSAYQNRQMLQAANFFDEALKLAESIDDIDNIVMIRFWKGDSLLHGNKLRKALEVLAPTLQDTSYRGGIHNIFNTLTTYIEIAIELPVTYNSINNVFDQSETFLRNFGRLEWIDKLLHLKGKMNCYRGFYQEALESAQESWIRWRDDYPGFVADTHMESLIRICINLRDADMANNYMSEWKNQENQMPIRRERDINMHKSNIARLEGRFKDSLNWAKRSIIAAEQTDQLYGSLITLVRALLCVGENILSRHYLARLLSERHSERGHIRYLVRLIQGDYHLSCARKAAGLQPVDDEFGTDFSIPEHISNKKATLYSLSYAKQAYDSTLTIAKWIDEQFVCCKYESELSTRYDRLEAMNKQI